MIAAFRSDRGASRRLLEAGLRREGLVLLVSVPLMIEYEAVLTRPDHLKAAGVSAADVGVVLDAVAVQAEPVTLDFSWRPALPDPDDDMVLETAVNGRADGIVTFNIRDFRTPVQAFGIAIYRPGEVLAIWKGAR